MKTDDRKPHYIFSVIHLRGMRDWGQIFIVFLILLFSYKNSLLRRPNICNSYYKHEESVNERKNKNIIKKLICSSIMTSKNLVGDKLKVKTTWNTHFY